LISKRTPAREGRAGLWIDFSSSPDLPA